MDVADLYLDTLETLGFTKQLSSVRIDLYNRASELLTIHNRIICNQNANVVISGSRGEGTGVSFDSDIDILVIDRDLRCIESHPDSPVLTTYPYPFLFKLDSENVPTGYTHLRLISAGKTGSDNFIESELIIHQGASYLRNDQLFSNAFFNNRQGIAKQQGVFSDRAGPAKQFVIEVPVMRGVHLPADIVLSCPCSYPSIVDTWCTRDRKCKWPGEEIIKKVKDLDVLVVPVGVQGSDTEILQWRVSLSLAERELVHSFNDCQIKLYSAMKMLAKHELKPLCDKISSYVIKNIIFWVFEETHPDGLEKRAFYDTLLKILKHLKVCVTWGYLRNYMNPSLNLLKGRISQREKVALKHRIEILIKECPDVLIRCPRIKERFELSPYNFQKIVKFRKLTDQIGLCPFALPHIVPLVLQMKEFRLEHVFQVKEEYVIEFCKRDIWPYIRQFNPFGFFDLIVSMSDHEIVQCLREGIAFVDQ